MLGIGIFSPRRCANPQDPTGPGVRKTRPLARFPTLADDPGISGAEGRAARDIRWQRELAVALRAGGKSSGDIAADPKGAPWKITAAVHLRLRVCAPHRWIVQALNMGAPASVRVYVSRRVNL
jgi:hypothetical protein